MNNKSTNKSTITISKITNNLNIYLLLIFINKNKNLTAKINPTKTKYNNDSKTDNGVKFNNNVLLISKVEYVLSYVN